MLKKDQTIGVDKIIRFENINVEINQLSKKINFDISKFKKLNTSTTDNYREYYDINTKKIVDTFCEEDLDYFKYSF